MFPTYPSYNQLWNKGTFSFLKASAVTFLPKLVMHWSLTRTSHYIVMSGFVLKNYHLLGQPFMLHSLSWVDAPEHSFPPFKAPCCMSLLEIWVPPPQLFVQDPHDVQCFQMQLTEKKASQIQIVNISYFYGFVQKKLSFTWTAIRVALLLLSWCSRTFFSPIQGFLLCDPRWNLSSPTATLRARSPWCPLFPDAIN